MTDVEICFVTHRYPPQTGGVETHVAAVAERLVARGHQATVVTADRSGEGFHRERRNGVRVRRHRSLAPGGAVHLAPGIARAVRRHAQTADVVHVHNYHSLPFTIGGLAAQDTRLVATPHYHGASDDPLRDRLLTLLHPVGRRVIRRADALTAVSEWERTQLADSFGVDATVVPNGVSRERFASVSPVAAQQPYLLTVGRLTPYKGIDHAIRALAALPDYELRVAGSGPAREQLQRVADETGVTDRVEFLGYVPDERLPSLYAGATAHLSLSTHEAFGLTVAESIVAGTPVVVRTARALREWTDTDGVVGVETPSPSAVADGVETAVDGPPPDPAVVATWDDVAERLLKLYRARDTRRN